jgi:hypothetical protein
LSLCRTEKKKNYLPIPIAATKTQPLAPEDESEDGGVGYKPVIIELEDPYTVCC